MQSRGTYLVQSKSYIYRFKRAFVRACKCNVTHEISMYKDKFLYPGAIPWQIRRTHAKGHFLQIMNWNASRSLQYTEFQAWRTENNYDYFII